MLPAGRVLAHKACRFAPRRQCNGPRQRRVARIASGYRCETARNLPGISQRSGQEPQMIAAWRWVDPTAAIKGAERRLHSDNPANRCRPQYRSAYLAAGRQRQHMGRDRSRRAGRRPPGRPFEVPWIPGGTGRAIVSSVVTVLPTITAPPRRKASTCAASTSGLLFTKSPLLHRVGKPLTSKQSLTIRTQKC